MKQICRYGSLILILFGLTFAAQSQPKPAVQKNFVLNADYSRFWQNDSTMYVEISTAIYPNLVILTPDSLGFSGKVELSVTIQNKSNGALVFANRFHIPVHLTDSSSRARTTSIVNNTVYPLGAGTYAIALRSCDLSDRSKKDSSFFSVDVQKRPDTLALSDIELCSNITASSDQKDIFYKNTYRVIPNPSCVFGSTTFPLAYTYMEFYNLNTRMTYTIHVRIVDFRGDVKKRRSYQRRFSMPNVVDVTTLNCTSISSGKYTYEVLLSDSLGHDLAKSQRAIFLHNPNVQPPSTATLSVKNTDFDGMSSDDLSAEFRTAKYVSQSEDIKLFEKLTALDAQKEFLGKFWSRVENGEAGGSNLTRALYLQRVSTANDRYGTYAKKGWRSDQGRVYIIYGEPDEIERYSNSMDSKPYEIWNYHQIEGGVKFVFIDLTGFNEYVLVHSTKRGEIQYAEWESLLKRTTGSQ